MSEILTARMPLALDSSARSTEIGGVVAVRREEAPQQASQASGVLVIVVVLVAMISMRVRAAMILAALLGRVAVTATRAVRVVQAISPGSSIIRPYSVPGTHPGDRN
ncbi:MAG: hypothetical protein WKF78_13795 [Candidatus Limnocylindrales bacterium]